MRKRPDDLAPGEWALLGLLAEGPGHGFALARALAPEGEVGRVWALRRPLVYRTIDVLRERGLVAPVGTEVSDSGPQRVLVEATGTGVRRLQLWLGEPVQHVRDARALLMLKLLFLDRQGRDATPLLQAQAARFGDLAAELEASVAAEEGFPRALLLWRLESTRGALRFVERIRDGD